jgi:hypothetical protein
MSVTKLEKLAAAALRHPDLRWIMKEVPARYADNGRVIASLLVAAATADPRFADNEAFATAYASLSQVNEARDLRDQVARLYHDPEIRAAAGDKLDWYFAHPRDAYAALLDASASGSIKQVAHDAMVAAQGAIDFESEHGGGSAPSTPPPALPSDPGKAEAEYKALIEKSITKRELMTATDEERMHALALGKVTRADAAEAVRIAALTAPKPEPGEYERLISESTERPLDAGKQGRLEELAGERAASAGLLEGSEL